MYAFSPRLTRAAIGLAAVSAFAFAPMAAQAAPGAVAGTLTGGVLTGNTPTIAAFGTNLTGVAQDVYTEVGTMNVNDATGTAPGWTVSVSATAPTVGDVEADAGTNGSITLTPRTMTATAGNSATTGPVATAGTPTALPTTGVSSYVTETAAPGAGQGSWHTTADTGIPTGTTGHTDAVNNSLHVVIPGDAQAGAYASTLTFTTAATA